MDYAYLLAPVWSVSSGCVTICHNGVYIYNIIFVYQLTVSVEKRKKILFARFDSLLSSATKSKAWEDVAKKISGVGGGRTAPETKKVVPGRIFYYYFHFSTHMLMGVFFYPQTHIFNRCFVGKWEYLKILW